MPICYITVSDIVDTNSIAENIDNIRDIVAAGLDSKARLLDRHHIAIRLTESKRSWMLGEIEIDIFAQFFLRRYFSRDRRANLISSQISKLLTVECATWINLCQVGYSRVDKNGSSFFSVKADDLVIRMNREAAKWKKT